MRRARFRCLFVLVTSLLALSCVPVPGAAAQASAPATRTVSFGGSTFTVPSEWPVIDLRADPTHCVRHDVSAVYLGHAGPDPRCPSHLVGKADGLQIESNDDTTAGQSAKATITTTINGEPIRQDPTAAADGETRVVVPRLSLLVTLSRSPVNSGADDVLRSLRAGPTATTPAAPASAVPAAPAPAPGSAAPASAAPAAPASAAPAAPAPASAAPAAPAPAPAAAPAVTSQAASSSPSLRGPTTYTGKGFDACTAPSEATMSAWLASPYRSVGVYIGGINKACSQPNLTAQWVTHVTNLGWVLVPIYVGLQAPCNTGFSAIDPAQATGQGMTAGDAAASAAAGLGLAGGSPIYFDMEGYNTAAAGCSAAVLAFLNGWTYELHVRGFASGIYSSAASGITDLVNNYNNPNFNSPNDIWFAHWNGVASVYGDPYVPDQLWSPHRRLHQTQGGHDESWGGVVINIDTDYDDGLTVGAVPGYVLDGWGGVHPFGGAPQMYGASYFPGQDVARGLALQPSRSGGYVLDDWGGVHPFGSAPLVYGASYWPGADVARAIALDPCDPSGTSGYVLDDWGGVHPFGGAPAVSGGAYWPGTDIARALTMVCLSGQPAGYVLDGWGGLHPVGPAPFVYGASYWPGQDIVTGASLTGPDGGYTLDAWGGVHPFGAAGPVALSAYWPGTHTARGLAVTGPGGGYVLDVTGGIHSFGNAVPQDAATFSGALAHGVVLAA